MKTIYTLILTVMCVFNARCQSPDIIGYSIPTHTEILQSAIDSVNDVRDVIEAVIIDSFNAVIAEKDSLIHVKDSIIAESKTLNPLMLADTFNYAIVGITDSLSVSVEKLGGHVKIGLKDGEKIVLYIDY